MKKCPNCDEDLGDESLELEICLNCGEEFQESEIEDDEICSECGEDLEDDDKIDEGICRNCQKESA